MKFRVASCRIALGLVCEQQVCFIFVLVESQCDVGIALLWVCVPTVRNEMCMPSVTIVPRDPSIGVTSWALRTNAASDSMYVSSVSARSQVTSRRMRNTYLMRTLPHQLCYLVSDLCLIVAVVEPVLHRNARRARPRSRISAGRKACDRLIALAIELSRECYVVMRHTCDSPEDLSKPTVSLEMPTALR